MNFLYLGDQLRQSGGGKQYHWPISTSQQIGTQNFSAFSNKNLSSVPIRKQSSSLLRFTMSFFVLSQATRCGHAFPISFSFYIQFKTTAPRKPLGRNGDLKELQIYLTPKQGLCPTHPALIFWKIVCLRGKYSRNLFFVLVLCEPLEDIRKQE